MTYNPIAYRIANYHYGDPSQLRVVKHKVGGKVRTFFVGIANAYNAYGLIGSECNGIFVLDHDNKAVLLDEHHKTSSGWCEPPLVVRTEFEDICAMDWEEFRSFVTSHPRSRKDHLK